MLIIQKAAQHIISIRRLNDFASARSIGSLEFRISPWYPRGIARAIIMINYSAFRKSLKNSFIRWMTISWNDNLYCFTKIRIGLMCFRSSSHQNCKIPMHSNDIENIKIMSSSFDGFVVWRVKIIKFSWFLYHFKCAFGILQIRLQSIYLDQIH